MHLLHLRRHLSCLKHTALVLDRLRVCLNVISLIHSNQTNSDVVTDIFGEYRNEVMNESVTVQGHKASQRYAGCRRTRSW